MSQNIVCCLNQQLQKSSKRCPRRYRDRCPAPGTGLSIWWMQTWRVYASLSLFISWTRPWVFMKTHYFFKGPNEKGGSNKPGEIATGRLPWAWASASKGGRSRGLAEPVAGPAGSPGGSLVSRRDRRNWGAPAPQRTQEAQSRPLGCGKGRGAPVLGDSVCTWLVGNCTKRKLQREAPNAGKDAAARPGGGETFLSKNTCFPGPEQTQCLRGGGSSWGCVYRASAGLRSVDTPVPVPEPGSRGTGLGGFLCWSALGLPQRPARKAAKAAGTGAARTGSAHALCQPHTPLPRPPCWNSPSTPCWSFIWGAELWQEGFTWDEQLKKKVK